MKEFSASISGGNRGNGGGGGIAEFEGATGLRIRPVVIAENVRGPEAACRRVAVENCGPGSGGGGGGGGGGAFLTIFTLTRQDFFFVCISFFIQIKFS